MRHARFGKKSARAGAFFLFGGYSVGIEAAETAVARL